MRISDWSSDVCSSDLVTPSAHHRIVEVPLGCGVGIKLRHLRSPTGRPAHLAVREPSAGADRKKETGCNGHPFPTMPHRLIVVGLGLDLFPLAGQEPAQRENFAGTFISIAVDRKSVG